jgi:hypothetical protein
MFDLLRQCIKRTTPLMPGQVGANFHRNMRSTLNVSPPVVMCTRVQRSRASYVSPLSIAVAQCVQQHTTTTQWTEHKSCMTPLVRDDCCIPLKSQLAPRVHRLIRVGVAGSTECNMNYAFHSHLVVSAHLMKPNITLFELRALFDPEQAHSLPVMQLRSQCAGVLGLSCRCAHGRGSDGIIRPHLHCKACVQSRVEMHCPSERAPGVICRERDVTTPSLFA